LPLGQLVALGHASSPTAIQLEIHESHNILNVKHECRLNLVPIWVAMLFIIRGVLVDSIRYAAISQGETTFGMMRSPWGRFLVAGRFMRGFYGAAKAVAFGWILLVQPLPALAPDVWAGWSGPIETVTAALVGLCVLLCVVRGLPVLIEFAIDQRVFGKARQVPR